MRHPQLHCILLAVTSGICLGQGTTVAPVSPAKQAPGAVAHAGTASNAAPSTADYSAEPLVIERMEHIYSFAADGTGTTKETIVARAQSDATVRQLGVLNIPFASATEHVEIGYVRVRRPDGTVTETPASQAIEMPSPVTTEAPFYSDLKQMQIPVRNLRVGDKLEWQATVVRTKAEAPGEFWGQDNFVADAVILSQAIEIRAPMSKHILVWSPGKVPAMSQEGDDRIFRWESPQLKPTVGKEADAEKERKKKHVLTPDEEVDGEQGKIPDISWTSFSSWAEVGTWYRSLESDRVVPDAEVKAKVAELVAGKTSEEEKVQAVYSYVATQIRYIGVAFGIGRYQPHHASEVLENQYGDCKDKHTLLAAMLTELGLHPSAVLIGAGIRFNEALPSPANFNHLITTVKVNGQQIWLDATAEVAPYQVLQFAIRDKQALVIPESGAAAIQRTPEKLPFDSYEKLDASGALDKDGVSVSRMAMTLRGDAELEVRSAFRSISPAQYDELMQRISQGMRYGGTVSHTEVSHLDDAREPIQIAYEYKREKAGDWDNFRIIPQLAPIQLPRFEDTDPPLQSILLGVPHVETSTSAMKLPEGWGAQLPEAVHQKSEYVIYDETYRFEKGTVYAERRIEILKHKVPLADYKSYKKWTDAVDLGNESYIQLTNTSVKRPATVVREKTESRSGTPAGDVTPEIFVAKASPGAASKTGSGTVPPVVPPLGPSTVPSNSEAAKLVAAAYQSAQRNELDEAKRGLDSAKAINPEQAWLWSTYATLELAHYQLPAAIDDFQKELALHPDTFNSYPRLAATQRMMNKKSDAKETLRKWATAYPDNPQPTIQLMEMSLGDEDAAGAVAAAELGMAQLPAEQRKNEQLQLILGQAQTKAGMRDKGTATLAALMKSTQDPGMMNNTAYELADAGKELPLAEFTVRTALEKLAEESKTWTLDENPQLLFGKSQLIVATWDTLGWILFKQGKVEEAQGYAKAAWINEQNLVVGSHLGEIAEAMGDKAGALEAYEMAIETAPKFDMMGVRKTASAKQEYVMKRAESLRKAGVNARDKNTNPQKIRTIPLGASKGIKGFAEYRLLLDRDKIEKVESSGDHDLPKGSDRIMEAKLSGFFPPDSEAKLARNVVLNCHVDVCELVLEPWPAIHF